MSKRTSRRALSVSAIAGMLWLASIAFGFWHVGTYQNAPGELGVAPLNWPEQSKLPLAKDRRTIVMFAHPKCPCTRASIGELAKVMTSIGPHAVAHVLFVRPPGTDEAWEKTDLWDSAKAIPGVQCWTDIDAVEAQRFGAQTSGMTFVYDSLGQLQFRGGVTASRGHHGDNDGADAVRASARTENPACVETRVFGCPLQNPTSNQVGVVERAILP